MCLLLPGFSDHHSSLFDLFSRNTDIKRGVFLEYHLLSNLAWKNKCYCFLLAPKYISTKHICCWHAAVGDSGHGGKWKDKASTLSQIIRLHENTAFMPHKGCSMTAGLSLTLAVPHDSPQTIALHFFGPWKILGLSLNNKWCYFLMSNTVICKQNENTNKISA